jgi:hypothetical protein
VNIKNVWEIADTKTNTIAVFKTIHTTKKGYIPCDR